VADVLIVFPTFWSFVPTGGSFLTMPNSGKQLTRLVEKSLSFI
jgi:hypothetical protein